MPLATVETQPEPLPPGVPIVFERARHFLRDIAAFVSDGLKMVSQQEYVARLVVCAECDRRNGNWCQACGCWLSFKARGRAWTCKLEKWPKPPENPNPPS